MTTVAANPQRRQHSYSPLTLAYHAVGSPRQSRLFVAPKVLEEHIRLLKGRGFQAYTFSDAERRRMQGTLPDRAVVFTFDDAEESIAAAAPILARAGWPATVFVVTNFADGDRRLNWHGLDSQLCGLSWEGLRGLHDWGWEIGAHTCSHPLLTAVSDEALARELQHSREAVMGNFGSCDALAYPYGRADARVAAAAEAAGYLAACTCRGVSLDDTPFLRPRVALWNAHTGLRLKARLSRTALKARRSEAARLASNLRRRRNWLPGEAES